MQQFSSRNVQIKDAVDKKLVLICTISLILAQLGEDIDIGMLKIISMLLISISSFIFQKNEILLIILFTLSSNRLLTVNGISIQLILTIIYCFRCYILEKKALDKKIFIISIVFMIYSLNYIYYGDIKTFVQSIKILVLILFCIEAFKYFYIKGSCGYISMIYYAAIGIIISVVIPVLLDYKVLSSGRFAISEASNQNALGILTGIIFCNLVVIFIKNKSKGLIVVATILAIIGFMTGSRTFFVIFLFTILWIQIPIFLFGDIKTKFLILGIDILIIIIFAFTLNSESENLISILIQRFINPRRGDISNGRFDLWEFYLSRMIENSRYLILGVGSYEKLGNTHMPHNMYIEQLILYGVMGNIILVFLYKRSFRILKNFQIKKIQDKKYKVLKYMPIISLLISGIFSHILVSITNTILLFLCIIAIIDYEKEGEVE